MFADDPSKSPQTAPPAQQRKLAIPVLLAGAVFASAASCERISFYSTGRSEPSPAAAPTSAAAGGSTNPTAGGTPKVTRGAVLNTVAACTTEVLEAFRVA